MSIHRIKLVPTTDLFAETRYDLPYRINQTDWVVKIIPQGTGLVEMNHEYIISRKGRVQFIGIINPDYNPEKDRPTELSRTLWRLQFDDDCMRAISRHKDAPPLEIEVEIFPVEPKLVKPSDTLDGHL